ncbi:MAG: hypothetical protein ACREDK_04810 [Thermoplasmata archaeon]
MTSEPDAPIDFPVGTFRAPTSVLVWGPHRYPLNRMLVALARRVDPGFLWLEIRDPDEVAEPGEPSTTGELGSSRNFVVTVAETLRPPQVLRSPRPTEHGAWEGEPERLAETRHLPEALQEILGRIRPGSGPRVVAGANLGRLWAGHPDPPAFVRRVLRLLRARGVTFLVSATEIPRPVRSDFDHVLHVTLPTQHPWTESVLEVEKGPLSQVVLGRVPVRHLAPFAREFSGG